MFDFVAYEANDVTDVLLDIMSRELRKANEDKKSEGDGTQEEK